MPIKCNACGTPTYETSGIYGEVPLCERHHNEAVRVLGVTARWGKPAAIVVESRVSFARPQQRKIADNQNVWLGYRWTGH